jgi:SpoVK/Ycf46/Vps4 family AAA+-type ATPase
MVRETQGLAYDDAEYSLLFHGPPGSSKTKMAEALSAEMWKASRRWGPVESRLLRITPADFTRSGEDRLDSEARVIFDLISGVRAVTIFFDEIDDLLRQRTGAKPRFMDLVTPAMLNRLADLRDACPRQEICFLLGTNYVENIDLALIRKGRIDAAIAIVYPDFESRVAIISKYKPKDAEQFPTTEPEFERIASQTAGWPYLDIRSCCERIARTYKGMGQGDFEEILNAAVLDRESTPTNTTYDKRKRITGELFDEYIHHLISCSENRQQCEEQLEENEKMKSFPNHRLILNSVLDKEERWLSGVT